MNDIHPTAVVHPDARMGDGNVIGPFCVIGPHVAIGNGNTFIAHCCIGTPGQHRTKKFDGSVGIGNRNTFHEFAQVHASLGLRPTVVKDDCYFMKGSHVAHDCYIEDGVTLCNDVSLGGCCYVMTGATLGLHSVVHQRQIVGSYSMIGMGSVVHESKDIYPGETYAGNPARHVNRNSIGLERNGVTAEVLSKEFVRFNLLKKGW